jgi:hypothetical protein
MGNIIHVDFKERQIANIKLNQIKFLTKHLPYIKARQKQLKEMHAPKSILDNEVRLIYAYTHRLNRLKAWWYKQMSPEERLLRAIFAPDSDM